MPTLCVSRKLESVTSTNQILLPPANEVWGKVICLQVCVCPRGAGPGGCLVRGVPARGGGVPGGDLPPTATAADGTHPTGMHSCSSN